MITTGKGGEGRGGKSAFTSSGPNCGQHAPILSSPFPPFLLGPYTHTSKYRLATRFP